MLPFQRNRVTNVAAFGGAPYSAAVVQFFDRLIQVPSVARQAIDATLIDGLVAGGHWSKILTLCVAGSDENRTLTNLKSGSFNSLSASDGAAFVADQGYVRSSGDVNGLINGVINLSTDAAQNDVCLFAWNLTNLGNTGQPFVATSGLEASGDSEIWLYNITNILHMLNSASEPNYTTPASFNGLWLLNRAASGTLTLDFNGTQVKSTVNTSAAPKNLPLQWARNTTQRTAVFGVASPSFAAGERTSLYSILQTYLAAIGNAV